MDYDTVSSIVKQAAPFLRRLAFSTSDVLQYLPELSVSTLQEVTAQARERGEPFGIDVLLTDLQRHPEYFIKFVAALKKTNDAAYGEIDKWARIKAQSRYQELCAGVEARRRELGHSEVDDTNVDHIKDNNANAAISITATENAAISITATENAAISFTVTEPPLPVNAHENAAIGFSANQQAHPVYANKNAANQITTIYSRVPQLPNQRPVSPLQATPCRPAPPLANQIPVVRLLPVNAANQIPVIDYRAPLLPNQRPVSPLQANQCRPAPPFANRIPVVRLPVIQNIPPLANQQQAYIPPVANEEIQAMASPIRSNYANLPADSPIDKNADAAISDLKSHVYNSLGEEMNKENPLSGQPYWDQILRDKDCSLNISRKEQKNLKREENPGEALLDIMDDRGYTIADLAGFFMAAGMEDALDVLKRNSGEVVSQVAISTIRRRGENNLDGTLERSDDNNETYHSLNISTELVRPEFPSLPPAGKLACESVQMESGDDVAPDYCMDNSPETLKAIENIIAATKKPIARANIVRSPTTTPVNRSRAQSRTGTQPSMMEADNLNLEYKLLLYKTRLLHAQAEAQTSVHGQMRSEESAQRKPDSLVALQAELNTGLLLALNMAYNPIILQNMEQLQNLYMNGLLNTNSGPAAAYRQPLDGSVDPHKITNKTLDESVQPSQDDKDGKLSSFLQPRPEINMQAAGGLTTTTHTTISPNIPATVEQAAGGLTTTTHTTISPNIPTTVEEAAGGLTTTTPTTLAPNIPATVEEAAGGLTTTTPTTLAPNIPATVEHEDVSRREESLSGHDQNIQTSTGNGASIESSDRGDTIPSGKERFGLPAVQDPTGELSAPNTDMDHQKLVKDRVHQYDNNPSADNLDSFHIIGQIEDKTLEDGSLIQSENQDNMVSHEFGSQSPEPALPLQGPTVEPVQNVNQTGSPNISSNSPDLGQETDREAGQEQPAGNILVEREKYVKLHRDETNNEG